MSKLTKYLTPTREKPSNYQRETLVEDFYSDKSRIVFCSSFRRLMKKAQVFSLEENPSVRNRLTHSLEVADVGRTLARRVGELLHKKGFLDFSEIECLQAIVENACLIHDLGNTPFGHFGESAVKQWFSDTGAKLFTKATRGKKTKRHLQDFLNFDGNPQGFRIAAKLHNELSEYGLNLTAPSLLASVKYPFAGTPDKAKPFSKKIGVFDVDKFAYIAACQAVGQTPGKRYFLAYLMELADDICYCGSDIADSFEKEIITSHKFKKEYEAIANDSTNKPSFNPIPADDIAHYSTQVSIKLTRAIIAEAAELFVTNLPAYLGGTAPDLASSTNAGKCLEILKTFAKRHIYTSREAQRIEIAGSTLMSGLLDHYGKLLSIPRNHFVHFVVSGRSKPAS